MPEFAGAITNVSVLKEGKRADDTTWTLYLVEAVEESTLTPRKFTTFDGAWKGKTGQTVRFEYQEHQRGEYTDYRIVPPRRTRSGGTGGVPSGLVLDRLATIEAKLDSVLDYIREKSRRS